MCLIPCMSCADNNSYMSCSGHIVSISQHCTAPPHLQFSVFPPPFLWCWHGVPGGMADTDVPLGLNTRYSLILSILRVWVSVLAVNHCREKLSWSRLKVAAIYMYKYKYLEGSLATNLFINTTTLGSTLGCMTSKPWIFNQTYLYSRY